jgi:hypothetical protein
MPDKRERESDNNNVSDTKRVIKTETTAEKRGREESTEESAAKRVCRSTSSLLEKTVLPTDGSSDNAEELNLPTDTTALTPGGLKCTIHGNIYQLMLLTFAAIKGHNDSVKFNLITEADQFEKFDDLVMDFGEKIIYLQAKHSSLEAAAYKKNDFITSNHKGEACLAKYCDSWNILRKSDFSKISGTDNSKSTQYIFFTNKSIKEADSFLEKVNIEDDLFSGLGSQTFKFKKDDKIREEFIEAIYKASKTFEKLNESKKIINQFLDEYIIKIGQPDSKELEKIIFKELAVDISSLGTKDLNNVLKDKMWNWFSDRSTCVLKSEGLKQIFESEGNDIKRYYLSGYTKSFKQDCRSKESVLAELLDITGLDEFITETTPNIAILEDGGGGAKLQIYKAIKKIKELKDDEWSFLQIYSDNINLLPDVFKGESTKFSIIDCRLEITDGILKKLGEIKNSAIDNNKKLIILVKSDKVEELSESLGISQDGSDGKTVYKKFVSSPLTKEQIGNISEPFNEKYISLSAKQYKVSDIITNQVGSVYELMKDADNLAKILKTAVELKEIKSEMPYGVYMANKMSIGEEYYKLSIITKKIADCYVVENFDGNHTERIKKYFKSQGRNDEDIAKKLNEFAIIEEVNESSFTENSGKTIIAKKISGKISVDKKLIKLEYDKSSDLLRVKDNKDNLHLPFPVDIKFPDQSSQDDFKPKMKEEKKLSLLMSPAGYGKSSFCINILEEYLKGDSELSPAWMVKIPLTKLKFIKEEPDLELFLDLEHDWQKDAWEKDYTCQISEQSRVMLILDGYDEIKNSESLRLINGWISKIPSNISVLITTREYAANNLTLPDGKKSEFYKLAQYDKEERDTYIKHYLKASINSAISDGIIKVGSEESKYSSSSAAAAKSVFAAPEVQSEFINNITKKIIDKISAKSSDILGIPLESYIFCELYRPYILKYIQVSGYETSDTTPTIFDEVETGNMAKLYQEFIYSKSFIFLNKHLGVRPDNITDKSLIFNLLGSYNQIIEIYALKQAFSLEFEKVEHLIRVINFNIKKLKIIEDTGLLRVFKDGDNWRIEFNHETYQEFYAAIAIIRGVVSGEGKLYELTKNLVTENRYNPKYYFILSFASQFSIDGGDMVPGYTKEKHLLPFWNLLGEDGDMLGGAAIKLFKNCISEFKEEEKEYLIGRLKDTKWVKFLKEANRSIGDSDKEIHKDGSDRFPFITRETKEYMTTEVKTDLSNEDFHKDIVANTFKQLNKSGKLTKKHVDALYKVSKEHEGQYDYWALDGGIDAISYTGKFFTKGLAEFLIKKKHDHYPGNETKLIMALQRIYKDICDDDSNEAKNTCFYVVDKIIPLGCDESNDKLLSSLLEIVNDKYIEYLIDNFQEQLSEYIKLEEDSYEDLKSKDLFFKDYLALYKDKVPQSPDYGQIFKESFCKMLSILKIAHKLGYAVFIDKSAPQNKLKLKKDKVIDIIFEESSVIQLYKTLLFGVLKTRYESDDNTLILDGKDSPEYKEVLNKYIPALAENETFDKLFDSYKDNKYFIHGLYKILYDNHIITKHSVDKYLDLLSVNKKSYQNKKSYHFWHADVGTPIAGYTGVFFNEAIKNYLIYRAGEWENNKWESKKWESSKSEAIDSLKLIHKTLCDEPVKSSEDYKNAVDAYNKCISHDYFKSYAYLEKIDYVESPTFTYLSELARQEFAEEFESEELDSGLVLIGEDALANE